MNNSVVDSLSSANKYFFPFDLSFVSLIYIYEHSFFLVGTEDMEVVVQVCNLMVCTTDNQSLFIPVCVPENRNVIYCSLSVCTFSLFFTRNMKSELFIFFNNNIFFVFSFVS